MSLPATGVMMSFCAEESRVRIVKFMVWAGGLLGRLVRVILVGWKLLLGWLIIFVSWVSELQRNTRGLGRELLRSENFENEG